MNSVVPGPAATKEDAAVATMQTYVAWSAGAGLLPIPGLDLGAIAAVQLKMLYDLSKLYELPFSASLVKSLIGALAGTALPVAASGAAASWVKMIPVIGQISAVLVQPALTAASTYALGKVFIQHFESGGTFLDFDPESVREHYRAYFEEAHQSKAAAPAKA